MPLEREITLNEGKPSLTLMVTNTGDRPVQVGSHFHFFEVNRCLSFDRKKPTASIWTFLQELLSALSRETEKEVALTAMGGTKRIFGLNDLTCAQAVEGTKAASHGKGKTERIPLKYTN